MKSRKTSILLAVFLGVFGVHRFYLGQTGKGILYLLLGVFTFNAFGFIDALIWGLGSSEGFDNKFNKQRIQREQMNVQKEMLEALKNK
tara:strand:+ start:63 stop:326 length:264 start_codon:yes stop_codon:yes gene_type:complete